MRPRRTGRVLWATGAVLGWSVVLSGCQSTFVGSVVGTQAHSSPVAKAPAPAANPPAVTLAQGTEIEWSVKTTQDSAGLIKAGRAVVGPDGTVVLGPYGTCKVGGMTVPQANRAVEKHLTAFMKSPSVAMSVAVRDQHAQHVDWRPTAKGQPQAVPAVAKAPDKRGSVAKKDSAVRTALLQPPDKEKKAEKAPAVETGPPPRVLGPEIPHHPGRVVMEPGVITHPMPVVVPHHAMPSAPDELNRTLLPAYVISPPDVLQIESLEKHPQQPVRGPHHVGPDGFVRLGIYGPVLVAGLTLDQAKEELARAVHRLVPNKAFKDVLEGMSVDVLAYNSKVYYVITDNAGQGENVISLPVTGNETVLDAISKINGLPPSASKRHIWVARRTAVGHPERVLPVDWVAITQRGSTYSNWQIMPGDRIYVRSDRWYTADRNIAKVLSPFERLFGATLLGSQTVNSIRSGSVGGQ